MAFIDRLKPAPKTGGFRQADYWTWCGSAIQGEDDRFHLFAARWPKTLPFFDGYRVASEVVHAVSNTPEGPYTFEQIILPDRGSGHWDGRMTHNPTVHRYGDIFLLFYIGATYTGKRPAADSLRLETSAVPNQAYQTIRIGMAWATSIWGPWHRPDTPILDVRPEKWDASVVTNPAACVLDDGRILLYYRSNTPAGLRIGLAAADAPDKPFERVADDPVLEFEDNNCVEDPYVWQAHDHLELIAKDMKGGICGERHAGIHATSNDGITWTLNSPPKAYSRTVRWDDGSVTRQGCLERPQLLIQKGIPTHLFAATADGPGGFRNCSNSWTMVIPLEPERKPRDKG